MIPNQGFPQSTAIPTGSKPPFNLKRYIALYLFMLGFFSIVGTFFLPAAWEYYSIGIEDASTSSTAPGPAISITFSKFGPLLIGTIILSLLLIRYVLYLHKIHPKWIKLMLIVKAVLLLFLILLPILFITSTDLGFGLINQEPGDSSIYFGAHHWKHTIDEESMGTVDIERGPGFFLPIISLILFIIGIISIYPTEKNIISGAKANQQQITPHSVQPIIIQPPAAKTKFCQKCGNPIVGEGQFCPRCDQKI
jgi:hypothetical protein